jgi:hypothetical protein
MLVFLASFPAAICGVVLLLWAMTARSSNDHSTPVYSPNREFAMRINYGPFGNTSVEVFRLHGLVSDTVFVGSLDDNRDPRWVSDGELEVFQTDAWNDVSARYLFGWIVF